jgi:GDP-4-dehydro-6-deoxy-D-mannose reductase
MKILVTGAGGFVGRHLVRELKSTGHDVVMTGLAEELIPELGRVRPLDITDLSHCQKVAAEVNPHAVIHLAGIAHTANTQNSPAIMFDINVLGAANVSRSIAELGPLSDGRPRMLLFVSSAFVYGGHLSHGRLACNETTITTPRTKYGEAKLTAEHAVRFFENSHYQVYVARPFNHIGPGQDPSFVVPGFVQRIKTAQVGGTIETGDLTALRDFTDVRDIARGYRLILEKMPEEKLFVFGCGKSVSVEHVLSHLLKLSGKTLSTKVNPSLLRSKEPEIIADPSLAEMLLHWQPEFSLEKTLHDVWYQEN